MILQRVLLAVFLAVSCRAQDPSTYCRISSKHTLCRFQVKSVRLLGAYTIWDPLSLSKRKRRKGSLFVFYSIWRSIRCALKVDLDLYRTPRTTISNQAGCDSFGYWWRRYSTTVVTECEKGRRRRHFKRSTACCITSHCYTEICCSAALVVPFSLSLSFSSPGPLIFSIFVLEIKSL